MEKNRQQLIEDVKKRLTWYTFEASEEEFNEAEVEALVQMLTVLEGDEETSAREDGEALERFWRFWDKRMADESTRDVEEKALPEKSKGEKAKRKNSASHRWIKPAAAVVAVFFIVVCGSFGSMAVKNNGFFYWLKRDKSGTSFITAPENLDIVTEQTNNVECYEPDQVPEEYKEYVVDAEDIEGLKDFEVQEVEVLRSDSGDSVDSFLVNRETGDKLQIGITIFPYKTLYVREVYSTYKYEYSVKQGEMEFELRSRPNPAGGTDYAVIFYMDNKRYTFSKQDDDQLLLEIAGQYYEYIVG